ncbi:hypothetical protein QTP88_002013 [Uroleucon formosanum]
MRKRGLEVDPSEKLKSHTYLSNSDKTKSLKDDAVPPLFSDSDIIEVRNIPSTSSSVNSGFVHLNKQSRLSSNYIVNMESNKTPLLEYIDLTNHSTKDFEIHCSVPGCMSDTDRDVKDLSSFTPRKSLSFGLQLIENNIVCERHLKSKDIYNHELLVNGLKKNVKSLSTLACSVPIDVNKLAFNSGNNVLTNLDKWSTPDRQSMSIDDFPTIDAPLKQKLKNITANGSLSISLKTIENSKIIESLDNLSSKTSAKSSLSIKLEPKIKHELPSPTISPKIKSNSSELPEIKPPVVPKCFSLMKKSNVIDSNLDHNTFHNSQHTIIGNKPSKAFKEKDYGYIFKISKTIKLPSSLWKSIHRAARNETIFYQTDGVKTFVKRVHFYNSLVPIITIYNMKIFIRTVDFI